MQQVADWLEKLGLGQYAQRFAQNDISFSVPVRDIGRRSVAPESLIRFGTKRWRRQAAECERKAGLATDDTLRQTYADLAEQWRQMADKLNA
jgi:SAM domain (Sterile alpha motif)